MKQILFTIIALCGFTHVFASHFAGAELSYAYNGSNYTINLAYYQNCGPSIPMPPTETVYCSSASLGLSFTKTIYRTHVDTTSLACTPGPVSCSSPSTSTVNYLATYYNDTVSLPPATDWVMAVTGTARGASTNVSFTSGTYYFEARLNNSTSNNVNTYLPNFPAYYITINNPASIPLQALDADGDSLVYEQMTPLTSATTNAFYNAGFSVTNPFGGGSCVINPATQTLDITSTRTGIFLLAIRVKEYRAGVLIGSHMREFQLWVLNGGTAPTFPQAARLAQFYGTACPGASDSVSLNFTDSLGEILTVTVDSPALPGWTFAVASPAPGSGLPTTIYYTAPATLNPAALPYFFINVTVTDDNCPHALARFAVLVRTRLCPTDSVWPGDANSDNVVNLIDPLYVAIAYSQTGPARPAASNTWVAQYCAPWANSFPLSGVNMKHADCNGNGTVNVADLSAIIANYSLTHPKPAPGNTNPSKVNGLPDLYFDLNGITLTPGATVSIPIRIGSTSINADHLYGIATRITLGNVSPAVAPVISNTNSILGSKALNFTYDISETIVDWVSARTDQQDISAAGLLGTLTFTIPASTPVGTRITFNFSETSVVNKDGTPLQYNKMNSVSTVAEVTAVGNMSASKLFAAVVPNPSQSNAELQFYAVDGNAVNVTVTDIAGRVVWQKEAAGTIGIQTLILPAERLNAGVYMVHITTSTNSYETMKWIKQ